MIKSSIIFLGTTQDSFVVGKGQRLSAGIVLQYGDNQFHIDPGCGALSSAKQSNINPRAHTAVFVTKNTLHKAAGLNQVVDGMTYGGFDPKGVLVAQHEVINGKEHFAPFLHTQAQKQVERLIAIQDGQRVGINEIEVQALKTTLAGSIGLKFITPSFSVVYSGDTKYSVHIGAQYKDAQILILSVPHLTGSKENKGLSVEDAITLVKAANPNLAIVTGFDSNFIGEDPVYQVRRIQQESGVQVIAAHDGLVIDPLSYSADQGQQHLSSIHTESVRVSQPNTLEPDPTSSEEQQTLESKREEQPHNPTDSPERETA